MKKMSTLFILFLLLSNLNAQNNANIWYFGDGAGLDFNSGSLVPIFDGQTYLHDGDFGGEHSEGTSVISDNLGNLLFYSNGEKVWDANHNVMPNGDDLLGHLSSTQAALIVPKPEDQDKYYLFTTDDSFVESKFTNGLRYSIVDMCLNDGLGDIVLDVKNILLLDTIAEKITATKHENNVDYWIVTHKYFSDAFYAYLITSEGIQDPVISNTGKIHEGNGGGVGQITMSPNGRKLAISAVNGNRMMEVHDFDNSTGVISNSLTLLGESDNSGAYSSSFSPDNSKLYFYVTQLGPLQSYVYQFDLEAGNGDPVAIQNSAIKVWNLPQTLNPRGTLQLGPDGKIYKISHWGNAEYLDVIEFPNESGAACNFQDSIIYLGGRTGSYGFPNFITSFDYFIPELECTTAIKSPNNRLAKQLSIHPNPVNDQMRILLEGSPTTVYSLFIYNSIGQLMKESRHLEGNGLQVDVNNLPGGIYFVQLLSRSKKSIVASFIKK